MKVGDLVRLGTYHREFGYVTFSDRYGIITNFDGNDLYDVLCNDGKEYVYSIEELEAA